MKPEIKTALELYEKADDLAKDWLVRSWYLKNEDREIAKLYYQKSCKERQKLTKRLIDLTNVWEDKNIGFETVGSILARKKYDFLRGGSIK